MRRLTGLKDESPEQVDAYIRDNALRFFDDVLAADDRLEALGCKIFIRHHPQFIRDLSRDEDSCIINLRRPNALAAYSSQLIAEEGRFFRRRIYCLPRQDKSLGHQDGRIA